MADVLDRPLGMAKIFGSIQKIDDNKDGTITVHGIASSESRDGAGEIIQADAMRAALPDYSRFPALREMHQPMAAGKVTEAEVDQDGITHIAALVVDPIAIVKIRTGVYAGFSIGGKVTKRDPADRSIITGLRLVEISLVDSPCNPDAVLSMWKADTMTEFKPEAADVIARAKTLAKAAGHQRFKDHLFEASQELISEHLLKNGEFEPPAETIEAAALVDEPATVVEAPVGDTPLVEAEAAADEPVGEAPAVEEPVGEAVGDEHGGEGAVENDEIEAAAQPDPAAALTDALGKAGEAIEAAAAPAAEAEAEASPVTDPERLAATLKSITLPEGTTLAKGMYEVSRFADLLCSFAYVQRSLAYEAESEADASPIPEELANAIAELGNILVRMAQEEIAELIASLKRPEGVEVVEIIYAGEGIEAAQQIVDLVKADETLMAAAEDRLAKRAPLPAADAEGEPVVEAALKARNDELEAENERLTKALGDAAPVVEDLTKRFTDVLEPLQSEIADLRKRFEAEPLPAKTAGTTRVVAKTQDSAGGDAPAGDETVLSKEQIQEGWDALSDDEKGLLLTKIALANPGMIRLPLQPAA